MSWLRSLHSKLGFPQLAPTIIHGDNKGSIVMVKNPQFHRKSKHIEHKWHWIQDAVESGIAAIESCWDLDQTADVLTKALVHPKHKKHVGEMGLAST